MARDKKPKFTTGDLVRVKPGTTDPDYPDLPMGGWSGTVVRVNRCTPPTYDIKLDQTTLDRIHPVYRKRCERDGLDFQIIGMGESDLEPDHGQPVPIEQPVQIVSRPLSAKDQDDRVRIALGLTSDDPLPDVDESTLLEYYRYLSTHLKFPFDATYCRESGPLADRDQAITVQGLLDPEEFDCDEFYGLFCRARLGRQRLELPLGEIEADEGSVNGQFVGDYSYWFWNNR